MIYSRKTVACIAIVGFLENKIQINNYNLKPYIIIIKRLIDLRVLCRSSKPLVLTRILIKEIYQKIFRLPLKRIFKWWVLRINGTIITYRIKMRMLSQKIPKFILIIKIKLKNNHNCKILQGKEISNSNNNKFNTKIII